MFPDANEEAAYELRDEGKNIAIRASLKDGVLDVEARPEPGKLEAELPAGFAYGTLRINGR